MAREWTLLERLSARSGPSPRRTDATAAEDLNALLESVRRHLALLLNARHGMAQTVSDYGLPALTDVMTSSEGYVERMRDAIRTTIEKYEPRLRRVRVNMHSDDPEQPDRQKLQFRVDAVLVCPSGRQERVWYEAAVRSTGLMDVSG